jgi:hypothetical protein
MRRVLIGIVAAAGLATAAAADTTVVITGDDCRALVEHRPAPDVAYQPGVDAHGRPVAPADLDPHPLALPETYMIDITVDLFERLGIPPQGDANYDGDVRVGTVALDADGRLTFNGRPITSEAQQELGRRCQELR